MKLFARIILLILTIFSGLWLLVSIPNVLASFKSPNEVAGAIGAATGPFLLFSIFLLCYVKLQPDTDDAKPSAPKSTGGKIVKGIVVIILGALIAYFFYFGVKGAQNRSPVKNGPPTQVRNASWAVHQIRDVSLESPWELKFSKDLMAGAPADKRATADYAESYDSIDLSKDFHIAVACLRFKPTSKPDFEASIGSVVNKIKQAATIAGDADPIIEVKPTMSGNLPARSLTYAGKTRPHRLRIDGFFVQDGPKIWHILVTYQSDFLAADASRVFKSVHVNAK
jgi:hypothetical protein